MSDMRGVNNPFFGKHHTDETRKRMSEHYRYHINSGCFKKGIESPNWRGGISYINEGYRKTPEFISWRNEVYLLNDFTCLECGKHGSRLNAHHILPFSEFIEERYNVDNGVVLCVPCHSRLHGKVNNNVHKNA